MKKVNIITMGCSKNLVDSEVLMGRFEAAGFETVSDAENAGLEAKSCPIVIINTCGFISDAKEESINTILEYAQLKEEGEIEALYVMGCLSERYRKELQKEIPQVDKYYGKFDWTQLISDLKLTIPETTERKLTTPPHYAYIKISEGCDRGCAYCAIPIMTGKHISRPEKEILDEVRMLVGKGVKEFQIIAQELTFYGEDIDGKQHIAELVEKMSDIEGVEWIRLHYAYPTHFPMDLLRVIRERDNVCKYIDIALQHISDKVLKNMRRNVTKAETYDLINTIRREVPGIYLRTTLMVGFPNETEEDFDELLDFVKDVRFERMGAFAYSEEEGTYAAKHYKDNIPEKTKQSRLDRLMRVQHRVAEKMWEENIGKEIKVIVDAKEGDYYVCRSQYSSPEVDPEVLVPAKEKLTIGEFYNVRITDAMEFDYYAEIIS